MKKLLFLLMIVPGLCNAQPVQKSDGRTKEEYLQKSKNQNAFGIVTISGGGLLFMIGGIMGLSEYDFDSSNDNPKKEKTANVLMATGAGMVLVSIPIFLSSIKNKQKAAALTINSHTQPLLHQNGIATRRVPALTFTISF